MATSFTQYMPFDSGAGADVTESGWRSFMKNMLASGVISGQGNELDVFADSTGMQVKVPSGEVWIRGHWGELESETTLAIDAAPTAVGESRIDRVIVRCDFGDNVIELDVLKGTATTGTPSVPSLTQNTLMWEIALKQVTVEEDVVTIDAADVTTDERLFVGEIATSNRPSLRVIRDTDLSLSHATYTLMTWSEATKDNTGMWSAGSPGLFTIQKAGLWDITGYARVSSGPSAFFILPELAVNMTASGSTSGATGGAAAAWAGRTSGHGTPVSVRLQKELEVGDVIRFYIFQDSGGTEIAESELAPVGSSLTAYWIGPSVDA